MRLNRHKLREKWPTLAAIGVAVQRFPTFAAIGASSPFNTHDVLYASFLVRGRCHHDIGDQRFAEQAGSLAVVQWDVPHRIDTDGKAVSLWNIYLDPARHALPGLPADLRGALARLIPVHPGFANRRNRLLACSLADPRQLDALLLRMWDEQQAAHPGHHAMLEAMLRELLVLVARQLLATGVRGPADAEPEMERASAWLAEHLADEVGVDDLAQAVGLSRFHCSRRFLAYVGRTPMAYLMDLRLQEAALRLRGGDEPVVEVAVACGFKDLGHFGRRFKAMFGMPPARYRAQPAGSDGT